MKALTIWQPWASLIMEGAKPYEFRGWKLPAAMVGQRIVIHAGARPARAKEIKDLLDRIERGDAFGTGLQAGPALDVLEKAWRSPESLMLAAGLGTALFGEPKRAAEIFAGQGDSDRIDQHVWGWPLTDIQPFDAPVPARGLQGFWYWREAV